MCNACQLSHTHGLASSAFARHYSRNHCCFLFLWVLRCFTSPRSLQLPYVFRQRLPDMTPVFQGFPIRKSTDQSSFTSSPWLIAGYNVLHRLLMPRHPPIALSSLSPQNQTTRTTKDARVHYTILNHHRTPRTTRQPAGPPRQHHTPETPAHHNGAGNPGTQQRAHPPHPQQGDPTGTVNTSTPSRHPTPTNRQETGNPTMAP